MFISKERLQKSCDMWERNEIMILNVSKRHCKSDL